MALFATATRLADVLAGSGCDPAAEYFEARVRSYG
jgi:hypothetical protein